jgi:hypothetical protein
MLMRVMLVNRAGKSLGVVSIAETDTIVKYGGGYFARVHGVGTIWRGEPMPIFRQPESFACLTKLDHEFPAGQEFAAAALPPANIGEKLLGWCTDWNGAPMVRGEPPRDGLHCDDLYDAAAAIAQHRTAFAHISHLMPDQPDAQDDGSERMAWEMVRIARRALAGTYGGQS